MNPLEAKVREHFGVTEDLRETGYVLSDGTFIDLSGRHYASGYVRRGDRFVPKRGDRDYLAAQRSVDHRELPEEIKDELGERGTQAMLAFLVQTGALRVNPGTGFAVYSMPTVEAVRAFVNGWKEAYGDQIVIVDVRDPEQGEEDSREIPPDVDEIMAFIEPYFEGRGPAMGASRRKDPGDLEEPSEEPYNPRMPEIMELPAYQYGHEWAKANVNRLRELFSGKELITQPLRDVLWPEAEELYPSHEEDWKNDLQQTAWVAGAMRHLVDLLPLSQEGYIAIFDAAMELGFHFSSEQGAQTFLERLQKKPARWWKKKFKDKTPDDVVIAAGHKWYREIGRKENRAPSSRWQILKYVFGSREMSVLATLEAIESHEDGRYHFYTVEGEHTTFDIMSKNVIDGGVVLQWAGDITG